MCFNCVFYTSHYIRSLRNNAHRTEFNSKFEQAYGSRHAYHDAILYECGNLEFVEYIVYRYIDVYIQFVFRPPISISLDSIIHARKIFFLFTMTLEDEKNWKLTTIYWNRLQSTIAFLVRLEYIEGLFPIFCHNSCDIDCWHFFRVENFFPFEISFVSWWWYCNRISNRRYHNQCKWNGLWFNGFDLKPSISYVKARYFVPNIN